MNYINELTEAIPVISQSLDVGNYILIRPTKNGHIAIGEYRYKAIRMKHRAELVAMVSDLENEVICAE